MQFERLRKSHKKEIIIGALAVCVIGGILTFATSRAFYRVDDSIDLAKGTINYKAYDFKIMAMYKSEDGSNYTEIEEMPSEGYIVNEEKSYCTINNVTQVKGKVKTIDGNISISNLNKNDKCFIWFDKYIPLTGGEIILANLGTSIKTETPTFSNVATTNEGVYATEDGMYGGTTHYWRGAVENNYVKFANFCWRIVRINGDGSIRIIYDGTSCHANTENTTNSLAVQSLAYNSSYDRSEYVGWTYSMGSQRTTGGTASNVKSQTDSWYTNNIGNNTMYAGHVADGKFCNDRNTASGYTWSSQPSSTFYYAGRERLQTNKTPTLACPTGDVYTLKAGAITADEIVFAGGIYGTGNNSYYLYNGQYYWTMSPYNLRWNGSNRWADVSRVNEDGSLGATDVNWTGDGLRPVINLKSDITFSDGDGTLNNPYVVAD